MDLNTILIILGVIALIALVVHGLWSNRREKSKYFKSANTFNRTSKNGEVNPFSQAADPNADIRLTHRAQAAQPVQQSVQVIEWGRDKAEHLSDSRLELDFTRLTGADARFAYSGAEEFSWDDEDDESDEDTDTPEPRLLRVRAFGPRWEHAFDALKEALQSA